MRAVGASCERVFSFSFVVRDPVAFRSALPAGSVTKRPPSVHCRRCTFAVFCNWVCWEDRSTSSPFSIVAGSTAPLLVLAVFATSAIAETRASASEFRPLTSSALAGDAARPSHCQAVGAGVGAAGASVGASVGGAGAGVSAGVSAGGASAGASAGVGAGAAGASAGAAGGASAGSGAGTAGDASAGSAGAGGTGTASAGGAGGGGAGAAGGSASSMGVGDPATALGNVLSADPGSAPGSIAPGEGNVAAATSAAGQGFPGLGFPRTARQEALDCQRELSLGRPCPRSHYVIHAIYFNRNRYRSTSDCLTAAYSVGLPLELCR